MTSLITNAQIKLINAGRRIGRPDILFWTLPYLMVLIFVGTIAQRDMGLFVAQQTFFSSFYFTWQGVPFLGGMAILTILSVNLTCKFLFLSPWTRTKIGIHITHLSIIILLIGGLLTSMTMKEGFIPLREGQTRTQIMAFADGTNPTDHFKNLPFSIKLNSFQRDVYPGTNMPREYESRVIIIDGDIIWPASISMNNPLRYRGYTFFQNSTSVTKDGKPISILSVVTNKGQIFPYISGILLAIGLIIHMVIRIKKI